MAISADLGEKLEAVVNDLVANGRYNSKSEVLREGVRLVQEREAALARLHRSGAARVGRHRGWPDQTARGSGIARSAPSTARWARRSA